MYVGVDLVKIERWERILEKFPARAEKIFTAEEIAHCEKKGKKWAESYAALWGAREAAGKALGIGIFGSAWQDAFADHLAHAVAVRPESEPLVRVVEEALAVFFQLRDVPGLRKKPSTSELIDWLKLLLADRIPEAALRERDPSKAIPPLYGALLKNEQDVHLLERLAFMHRRQSR